MIFVILLYLLAQDDKIGTDGLTGFGIAAFIELIVELLFIGKLILIHTSVV